MIKKIAIVLVVLIVAVLGVAMTKPNTFQIQRSGSMKAPPEKVFAIVSDFTKWESWSPWAKMDPNMKKTLSGPPAGKGAIYEWDGNNEVGQGRMEILESTPPSKVVMKLDFIRPFEAHNTVEFNVEKQGDGTQVTWKMMGPNPLINKVMQVFMNFDAMVGKDFETGLSNLKALAEKP